MKPTVFKVHLVITGRVDVMSVDLSEAYTKRTFSYRSRQLHPPS